jgi:IgGFc binding protein/PEP-CTERM motif
VTKYGRILCTALLASGLWAGTASANLIVAGHENLVADSGSLFIFGAAGVTGTATSGFGFNQAFTIPGAGVIEINVPTSNFIASTENDTIVNKAIFINSASPISAHFLNRASMTSDMTYLHDVDSLGTRYRVLGFTGEFGEGAQLSVTATADNTTVTITPSVALNGNAAGVPFTRTLQAGESIKYSTGNSSGGGPDPSGTTITADNPIAVFSGAECTQVPSGTVACDHIVSQLPSTDNFDDRWIVPETPNQGAAGNIVRVLADEDNTVVTINGTVVATLNAGQVHTVANAHDMEITTSKKALVGQYLRGQGGTGTSQGDPAFSFLPGVNQLLDEYVFSTPVGVEAFAENFLSIAIQQVDLASLMLNGVLVNPALFTALAATGWSTANLAIAEGSGKIVAANPFFASISGFDNFDSYLTIIGATFSPGASPPPPPTDVPEPASLGLFGIGILGFGILFLARRRRNEMA